MDAVDGSTHRRHTQAAYDQLASVWSATTDDGPWNGRLERPAFRSLVPRVGTMVTLFGMLAGLIVASH